MRHLVGFVVVLLLAVACAPPAAPSPTAAPAKPAATTAPAATAAAKPAATTAPAAKPTAKPAVKAMPDNYFSGKSITLLVNFSAGGPTDIFARMMIPYLEKYIPGKPSITVQNLTGAGGLIGLNSVYSAAKKDGTVIGVFSAPFQHQALGVEEAKYDTTKFVWLGGAVESQVGIARDSAGMKNYKELPQTSGKLIAGGLAPDSSKDLSVRSFYRLMGYQFKWVTGFPGSADAKGAFLRGEINYWEDSLTSWSANFMPYVKEGWAFNIAQRGITQGGKVIRDPRVQDIPTFSEAAIELKGADVTKAVEFRAMEAVTSMASMLRAIVYPPGVDPAVGDAVRKAFDQTFADKEFQAQAQKQVGFQFVFVPGAEAQAEAERIIGGANDDKEAVAYLKKLSLEKN